MKNNSTTNRCVRQPWRKWQDFKVINLANFDGWPFRADMSDTYSECHYFSGK